MINLKINNPNNPYYTNEDGDYKITYEMFVYTENNNVNFIAKDTSTRNVLGCFVSDPADISKENCVCLEEYYSLNGICDSQFSF